MLVTTVDALGHFETVITAQCKGMGESRVGEVRSGTTSPMPEHKGFYATVTVRDPPNHTRSLRVIKQSCPITMLILQQSLTHSSYTDSYTFTLRSSYSRNSIGNNICKRKLFHAQYNSIWTIQHNSRRI